ncbi:hypothetical protein SAMN05444682_102337 [Parapedobacter indicus]|uniref:3-hydroxymyristoyl/3-hydroxydecanoyl-(Acyl carrier protein) dehydratase n=2 Tax=Parapedobacter indicus TaxID=1477437 RepID=A0A1I3FHV7_9SPHI|nr:hypothetical protein CLV26_102337 [Parapedobacter indicus]SFI10702.1 hypothetical protein SAMN05444682_102337 [Parapedobacter indicus]
MVMVDRVVTVDGFKTETSFVVRPDCLFVQNGTLSEMGMLENLAQTSFIFLNYFFIRPNEVLWDKEKDNLGVISTILDLEVQKLPNVGDQLLTCTHTELVFTSDFLKICNIQGRVSVNGETALQASMKMLLQTEDQ